MFYNITPVVKNLLIFHIGMFIVQLVGEPYVEYYLSLHPMGTPDYYPFQLLTNVFIHGGFFHMFMNMLFLFFFGPMLEQAIGEKRFLILYIIGALGATLFHVVINETYIHSGAVLLGASGAINAVVIGAALIYPDRQIYLYFIPVKFKYLAIFWLARDLMGGMNAGADGIAHFAHIGGAVVGAVLILMWKNSITRY